MQNATSMSVYEAGLRGRPVPRIQAGDLADPYRKPPSPWRRVVTLWSAIVDIARETRELEARLLGRSSRRFVD